MTNDLRQHLNALQLPDHAVEWLLMVWIAIQVFDDVADGDPVKRSDLDAAIWNTLVAMPQNLFFAQNAPALTACLASMILKWQASDRVERDGSADARSYMWRAGYYDLILTALHVCKGPEYAINHAHIVMGMYGETYEDYLKEFGHA